jgi:hypothetical protein
VFLFHAELPACEAGNLALAEALELVCLYAEAEPAKVVELREQVEDELPFGHHTSPKGYLETLARGASGATSRTLRRRVATNNAGGASVLAVGTSGTAVFGKTTSTSQPALSGKNTGGGPAGSFVVNSGVSPFTVSSQTKVTNLNTTGSTRRPFFAILSRSL